MTSSNISTYQSSDTATTMALSAEHIIKALQSPVILLSPDGQVLNINNKAQALVGGPVTHLADVFMLSNQEQTLQTLYSRVLASTAAIPCKLVHARTNDIYTAVISSIRSNPDSRRPDAILLQFDTRLHGVTSKIMQLNQSIHEQAAIMRKLRNEGLHDTLTGLKNRRYVQSVLEMECRLATRHKSLACCALLDIDHFKSVNDTHGHNRGDDLLKALGRFLLSERRSSDIVGRWGGEEFVLYFHDTDIDQCFTLCDEIRQKINEGALSLEPPINCTVSIGITQLDSGDTLSELINRADCALYEAKESGRNKVCSARIEN